MSTLRFRCWNHLAKRLEYSPWLTPAGKVTEPDGEEYDFVVMQSTGRHDRNGKEVFEGDVLKGVYGWDEAEFQMQWDVYAFGLRCVRDFFCGPKNDIVYAAKDQWIKFPVHVEICEVIGNIYEHPHILE